MSAGEFTAFQEMHDLRIVTTEGDGGGGLAWVWEYFDSGAGEVLLMLPGFFGVAGTDYQYILALEKERRVISLTYPAEAAGIGALVDGLVDFLDQLGIARVDLLGGSYSGYVAQVFVRRHPDRVRRLILAQTGAPDRRRLPLAAGLTRLFRWVPQGLLGGLMRLTVHYYYPGANPEQTFWRGYFLGLVGSFTKQALFHRFCVVEDYHRSYRLGAADLAGWAGQVLLLESEADGMLSQAELETMRQLYPRARRVVLSGSHIQSVDQPAGQIEAIRAFLLGG